MLGCLLTLMLAVPSLQSELKILSTPDGDTRPPPCALTCTGVKKYIDTDGYDWRSWSVQAFKHINMEDCGFVSTPVVTVTVKGPYDGVERSCPPIYVQYVGYKTLTVFTVGGVTASLMNNNKCDVYWTANGYNC